MNETEMIHTGKAPLCARSSSGICKNLYIDLPVSRGLSKGIPHQKTSLKRYSANAPVTDLILAWIRYSQPDVLKGQEMPPLPAWGFWAMVNAQHFDCELLENQDSKQPQ